MASLDVESRFNNITLEEAIENCGNDLFFDKYKVDNLTKQDLHDLLSAAAKELLFIAFHLGSQLGPILGNAFLCHYEKECSDSCPVEFKPKLYRRYVDGIFVMFQSRDHVKTCVDHLNTKQLNIRFTFEIQDQF